MSLYGIHGIGVSYVEVKQVCLYACDNILLFSLISTVVIFQINENTMLGFDI